MAVGLCLPTKIVQTFREALKGGKINPEKLADMSSAERHSFFSDLVGKDHATTTNSLFESKLLLKNQKQGMISWASKVAALKPELRKDLISKISRLDRVLDPEDKQAFLHDLASTKLGVNVTQAEAKTISDLSKSMDASKSGMKDDFTFNTEQERLNHGRSIVDLQNYVDGLKGNANKFSLKGFKKNPLGASVKVVSGVSGLAKSAKASLDNSVIGRQGLKVLLTHPTVWLKNSKQSFIDMARTFGGREVMDEVRADVLSRQNALNGLYRREKLDLGNTEEAYPTNVLEKIPVGGKFFKASEAAFTAFQYRTRADLLDGFAKLADKTGGDIKGMGIIANGLTGRGRLGAFERASKAVNSIFFSPRLVMSNINALTGHLIDYKDLSPLARKEAAKNTVKIISGVAGIMALANAVKPGSVEFDPRSSDFGKIRIGDTRFDISGGMASVATLAAREYKQSSKNSSTGIVSKFNSGVGSETAEGTFFKFLTGKEAPVLSVATDLIKHKDYNNKPITLKGEVANLVAPLGVTNFNELRSNPRSANLLVSMIADGLGISTNTYSASAADTGWGAATTKEVAQFKQYVSADQFKQAATDYSTRYNKWANSIKADKRFASFPQARQQAIVNKEKDKIQKDIFKQNGFKYHTDKSTSKEDKQFIR